ncbi:hypothetical protein P168DRAFT_327343 [Aspergillus campestris IBT 28561]|uniref:Uncharacterized protein n=1 Tax=Aspergillus campestris (strain IBT 28561) TaxID=1392248 RepID=A0A2I1D3E6_ASPC2|nr:uncharacterized protein P168DRAFT_327343 [Aspergillus campestris IBT 28561]PKY04385.1 hypothetical protein P168DRAFT_327343 [Aspergillus campestris IBT 28561]
MYDSELPAENLNKNPPVLFLLRPQNIITEHPIDFDDDFFTRPTEAGVPEDDPSPATQVKKILDDEGIFFHRGVSLSQYIEDWAMDGYLRCFPTGCPNLATFCGIQGVGTPHALNAETRGFQRYRGFFNIRWETRIYEYGKKNPNGVWVSLHSIVTAMRCRAYQPATFDEDAILVGDAEQSQNGEPEPDCEDKLAFKDEKRFPVMMVSLVGPQHVRALYACMDAKRLSQPTKLLCVTAPASFSVTRWWREIKNRLRRATGKGLKHYRNT